MIRGEEYVGKRMMVIDVPGKTIDGCAGEEKENDLTEKGLSGEEAQDRAVWR